MSRQTRKSPRWLIGLQGVLCLYHVGAVLWALQLGGDAPHTMSVPFWLQVGLNGFWAAAFAFSVILLINHRIYAIDRSVWLIGGFLLFVVVRYVLFVRADYDRNRLPLLLAGMVIIFAIFLIVRRFLSVAKNMEKGLYDSNRSED